MPKLPSEVGDRQHSFGCQKQHWNKASSIDLCITIFRSQFNDSQLYQDKSQSVIYGRSSGLRRWSLLECIIFFQYTSGFRNLTELYRNMYTSRHKIWININRIRSWRAQPDKSELSSTLTSSKSWLRFTRFIDTHFKHLDWTIKTKTFIPAELHQKTLESQHLVECKRSFRLFTNYFSKKNKY